MFLRKKKLINLNFHQWHSMLFLGSTQNSWLHRLTNTGIFQTTNVELSSTNSRIPITSTQQHPFRVRFTPVDGFKY